MEWIKVKTRKLDSEEQGLHLNTDFIWDMETPEDGDEVLISDGKSVWTDTWFYGWNSDCGFENTDFKEGENLWYMPFPEPPKVEEVE